MAAKPAKKKYVNISSESTKTHTDISEQFLKAKLFYN